MGILTRPLRHAENKLRAADRQAEKQRARRGSEKFSKPAPTLCVRLLHDVGKLPASVALRLPEDIALSLILRRLATPVGDMKVAADAVIDCDWEDIAA
jgi:hypothetical protein